MYHLDLNSDQLAGHPIGKHPLLKYGQKFSNVSWKIIDPLTFLQDQVTLFDPLENGTASNNPSAYAIQTSVWISMGHEKWPQMGENDDLSDEHMQI